MSEASGEYEPPRATSMVVIFQTAISGRVPTFHRWGPHQFHKFAIDNDEEIRTSTFATACGLVMDHTRWVERWPRPNPVVLDEGGKPWVGMRYDNASTIGKPCGKCWRAPHFGSCEQGVG
jgi:hypothetical protein